jgi:hypothetical protein
MTPVFFRQQSDLIFPHNSPMPAAENKLAARKMAQSKHALALAAGLFDGNVSDHSCLGHIPL